MRKLITIILVLATSVAFGQTTYQLNYDSIRVGKTAGNGATSLYGKTYLKNATEGTPSDSVLTVRNGRVYKIAGSAISSVGFLTYVFSRTASDISGYEQMPALTSYTIGAADTATVAATTTPAIIQEFATNTGFPNTTLIPAGVFNVTYQTQKNSGSQSYYTYAIIYKRNLAGTETAIATTNNSSSVSANTVQTVNVSAVSPSDISLLTTDRIIVKVFAVMVTGTANISIYYDDATDSRLAFPSALVDATNFVPYNGAVKDLVSAFSITGDSIKRVGGTAAQFLMGNGTVQDTTAIQTVSNFFPKGDTRYVTKATNQTSGLTGNKTWDGQHIFTTPIKSSGADLRNLGGLSPIGLNVGSSYTIVGQPKTLMDFYGQSTINGAVDFNSYNGSGGNKITPFSWKANGSTKLLDTLTLQSATTAYTGTITIGTDTNSFSKKYDLGGMVFANDAQVEAPGESNPSFWFHNKTPSGFSGLGFRNTAGEYVADLGYSNLDSVLYFRSSSFTKALVIALHPTVGENNGLINMSKGRVNFGGFEGLTTRWRAALNFVKNTFTVGDTTSTTTDQLQVVGTTRTSGGVNMAMSSGNVGIGIVPKGIGSTKTLELGNRGALYDNNSNFAIVNNGWNDGSWKYKETGYASLMGTDAGTFTFLTAPSGTQNNTFSFTERFRIGNTGVINIPGLSGTGTRMLTISPTGDVGQAAIPGGGGGSVTGVAVATANGLAGTSDGASVVPTLTLTTTVNAPILAGNGTAISAATTTGTGSTAVLSASPALTGNPTAPTQTQGDNSTKIATTAYVDALGGTILAAQKQIATNYANINTSGTTTEALFNHNIAQSNLSADGDRVDFNFAGIFDPTAFDKFVSISVGGNSIAISGNASNKSEWEFSGYLMRTTSTTFRIFIKGSVDDVPFSTILDRTVTDFNPLNFQVLGQTNNSGDPVTLQIGYLQARKAP